MSTKSPLRTSQFIDRDTSENALIQYLFGGGNCTVCLAFEVCTFVKSALGLREVGFRPSVFVRLELAMLFGTSFKNPIRYYLMRISSLQAKCSGSILRSILFLTYLNTIVQKNSSHNADNVRSIKISDIPRHPALKFLVYHETDTHAVYIKEEETRVKANMREVRKDNYVSCIVVLFEL